MSDKDALSESDLNTLKELVDLDRRAIELSNLCVSSARKVCDAAPGSKIKKADIMPLLNMARGILEDSKAMRDLIGSKIELHNKSLELQKTN